MDNTIRDFESVPPAAPADASQFLLRYLHDRDAQCPLCGYNLRDLTSPRCPECGQLVKITVTLTEPYLKAWILLVASTCAGAGIGLLLLAITAPRGWMPYGTAERSCFVAFWLMIPLAIPPLLLRRRFLRLNKAAQWTIAALAAVIVLTLLLVTVGLVR